MPVDDEAHPTATRTTTRADRAIRAAFIAG
jgi:hypothetical protein